VQGGSLAPSYEACQAGIRYETMQATELCRDPSNPYCPNVLNAVRAAQCAPVTIAAPSGPTGTDRFLQVLAILAAARSGHSSAAVLGPIQWNAYGPGVHMDGTGRAVGAAGSARPAASGPPWLRYACSSSTLVPVPQYPSGAAPAARKASTKTYSLACLRVTNSNTRLAICSRSPREGLPEVAEDLPLAEFFRGPNQTFQSGFCGSRAVTTP
jgi:hypothetical protein